MGKVPGPAMMTEEACARRAGRSSKSTAFARSKPAMSAGRRRASACG